MKIVVSSDWHLDASTAGVPRYDDLCAQLELVEAAALEADAFIFLGDLTDPDTPGAHRAVQRACATASRLAKAGVVNLWVAGNHDVCEDGSGTTTLSAIAGLELGGAVGKLVRVFERPRAVLVDVMGERVCDGPRKLAFVALPYPSRATWYDPADFVTRLEVPPLGSTPCLVGGHLWVEGAPGSGSESVDMARGRSVYWPTAELAERLPDALLVGGHYHRGQRMGDVLVAGSLERLTFGPDEQDEPRFLVLEVGS